MAGTCQYKSRDNIYIGVSLDTGYVTILIYKFSQNLLFVRK